MSRDGKGKLAMLKGEKSIHFNDVERARNHEFRKKGPTDNTGSRSCSTHAVSEMNVKIAQHYTQTGSLTLGHSSSLLAITSQLFLFTTISKGVESQKREWGDLFTN